MPADEKSDLDSWHLQERGGGYPFRYIMIRNWRSGYQPLTGRSDWGSVEIDGDRYQEEFFERDRRRGVGDLW